MLSLIKINDIHVKTLIMFMLLSEQARGRPGALGHHVGDPWFSIKGTCFHPIANSKAITSFVGAI